MQTTKKTNNARPPAITNSIIMTVVVGPSSPYTKVQPISKMVNMLAIKVITIAIVATK